MRKARRKSASGQAAGSLMRSHHSVLRSRTHTRRLPRLSAVGSFPSPPPPPPLPSRLDGEVEFVGAFFLLLDDRDTTHMASPSLAWKLRFPLASPPPATTSAGAGGWSARKSPSMREKSSAASMDVYSKSASSGISKRGVEKGSSSRKVFMAMGHNSTFNE
ncbi:Os05g0183732 [Oryza sativa Japonica Group]|uniref:Os05g0183732 protein n=1 Tax=Oryza sativa subsp. japonica TaxID=39947 RepID=A0A0P0WJ57_ORYSJ|nr:Os05g0183732 [Oryza sativa Japonica Group]